MRVHTDRLRKGMVIKSDVYTNSGIRLVNADTPVTKEVVTLLTNHLIEYVIAEYEQPKVTPSFQSVETISVEERIQRKEELKQEMKVAEHTVSNSLKAIVDNDEEIDVQGLVDMMNGVVKKAEEKLSLSDVLASMRESKESLYKHCVNVSMIGQVLAKWLGFMDKEVEMVSIAGLLHDIGLVKINVSDMNSTFFREVLDNPKKRYERHVIDGYNILKNKNIDLAVKQAILTHHERIDQSGFPLKVAASNINKISRVLAIADTYDILSMRDADNKEVLPLDVLSYLQELSFSKLDPNMMLTFIEKITYGYIQQRVLLSDGREGRIVTINDKSVLKPLVRTDAGFVDLDKESHISIVRFLMEGSE